MAQTGSTNRDLLELARAGASDGTVLVADHQTAGRGRLERTWVAPPGASLLASVLVRPQLDPADAPLLTVAMALAVVGTDAGRRAQARLKWPNDVVVDGDPPRKLGGILAESIVDPSGQLAVVIGVGVNIRWPDPLPPELESLVDMATTLDRAIAAGGTGAPGGTGVDRDELLADVLRGFERRCARLEEGAGGRAAVVDEARAASVTLGRRVRADVGTETVEGTAVDLDGRGDLVVEDDEGRRHVVVAGDVVQLRRA